MLRYLDRSWWRLATHEAGHAVVAWHSPFVRTVSEAKIGCSGGRVLHGCVYGTSRKVFFASLWLDITLDLAGLAGESLVYRKVPNRGSGSDLGCALTLANILSSFSSFVPPWGAHESESSDHKVESHFDFELSPAVKNVLNSCFTHARYVIRQHEKEFLALRKALMRHKKLETDALAGILGRRRK